MAPVLRRTLVAALLLAGAAVPSSLATSAQARPAGLSVTAWVLSGDDPSVVRANASGVSMLSIDGVTLQPSGRTITDPDQANAAQLARAGHAAGLHVEIVLSNYSNASRGSSPARSAGAGTTGSTSISSSSSAVTGPASSLWSGRSSVGCRTRAPSRST